MSQDTKEEIQWVDGLIAKRSENAKDFQIVKLSFKVDEFSKFLSDHNKNGWMNVDVKRSKAGKIYAQLDTWEPDTDF
tara:strand:+ start:205 stop:435 length:231 start_codon:yes stop_codon:yes gene_type:complete